MLMTSRLFSLLEVSIAVVHARNPQMRCCACTNISQNPATTGQPPDCLTHDTALTRIETFECPLPDLSTYLRSHTPISPRRLIT